MACLPLTASWGYMSPVSPTPGSDAYGNHTESKWRILSPKATINRVQKQKPRQKPGLSH